MYDRNSSSKKGTLELWLCFVVSLEMFRTSDVFSLNRLVPFTQEIYGCFKLDTGRCLEKFSDDWNRFGSGTRNWVIRGFEVLQDFP
jgi:hypothetical protein